MFGALLSLSAAILFGVSATLQKRSIMGIGGFSLRKLASDRSWRLSVIVGCCGLFVYIAALGSEPISVVQPFMSISMLVPLFAGWLFFREEIGTKWVHIILIIAGVALLLA